MSALVETLPGRCEGAHAAKICVLNALRHQRMVQTRERGCSPTACCAQRLTALEEGAGHQPTNPLPSSHTCSTPYGIRGWCRCSGLSVASVANVCSTPYGIRGWCSLWICTTSGTPGSAQRLTASEDGAARTSGFRNRRLPGAQRLTASEDGAVLAREIPRLEKHVLNALRHQRMVQTRGRTGLAPALACAQRLTASEDGAAAGVKAPARR